MFRRLSSLFIGKKAPFEQLCDKMRAADVVIPGRVKTYAEIMAAYKDLGSFFDSWRSVAEYRRRSDEVVHLATQVRNMQAKGEISNIAAMKVYENITRWCNNLPRSQAENILGVIPHKIKFWQRFSLNPIWSI